MIAMVVPMISGEAAHLVSLFFISWTLQRIKPVDVHLPGVLPGRGCEKSKL